MVRPRFHPEALVEAQEAGLVERTVEAKVCRRAGVAEVERVADVDPRVGGGLGSAKEQKVVVHEPEGQRWGVDGEGEEQDRRQHELWGERLQPVDERLPTGPLRPSLNAAHRGVATSSSLRRFRASIQTSPSLPSSRLGGGPAPVLVPASKGRDQAAAPARFIPTTNICLPRSPCSGGNRR